MPRQCTNEKEERERSKATHKLVLLAELVQLRVPVEHARADELVEDAEDDRREDGEDDVVEGEGPALLEHLTRERVLEGELRAARGASGSGAQARRDEDVLTQKPVMYRAMFL